MRVLIDADGCPVVDLAVKLCRRFETECILYCDTAHVFNREGARTITVGKGRDSADFALVNQVQPGDLAVTQDYGLAAMCLARGARVLNQNGVEYTSANMDSLLQARHQAGKIRRAGGRLRGPKARGRSQDEAFARVLEAVLAGER